MSNTAKSAAKLDPVTADRLQQGLAHQRANQFEQAADAYKDVLAKQPENPDALHFLGLALWNITQQADEPVKLIKRSMQLAPDQPQMHHNFASVLGSLGEIKEAVKHYRTALKLQPNYPEAYFNLGGVYKFSTDDAEIDEMRTLYASDKLSDPDREYICFGLSKALNDIGDYQEAMHFALEAGRLKNPTYDLEKQKQAITELQETLTPQSFKPVAGRGHDSNAPIFIVGMPRSGTTLVEQILSRHDDVFAAGELPMIGSINSQMHQWAKQELGYQGSIYRFLDQMPQDHFTNAAGACFQMVKDRANGQNFKRFTDKMPQNAFYLSLITMLFPNAKIIHVKRHPLDTCVSCFFQRFRVGHEYSYTLENLGQYYRHYAMTMQRFSKMLPLEMLEINYEDLVHEPQKQARALIDFAGLDWSNECLSPQDSNRSIMTASRWQVRQPIYKSSLDRWKRYESYLDPLVQSLGGWSWIDRHTGKKS